LAENTAFSLYSGHIQARLMAERTFFFFKTFSTHLWCILKKYTFKASSFFLYFDYQPNIHINSIDISLHFTVFYYPWGERSFFEI